MQRLFGGRPRRSILWTVALSAVLAACGSDDGPAICVAGTTEGCDDGLVCETVVGASEPACFAPVTIEGRVFDIADDSALPGATVVALDANGGARTTVVESGADGRYLLPIAVARDAQGNPTQTFVTLRVAALGYQPFPTPPRMALPVEIDQAVVQQDQSWVLDNAATDVGLLALAGGSAGLVTISGRVDVGGGAELSPGGVLVVAEQGAAAVSTAVSDTLGAFKLFNVPSGDLQVGGYRAGLNVAAQSVTTAGGPVADLVLPATAEGLATVTGSVNMADAPGGSTTSVLLVVASTFDETAKRGESPAGLRADNVSNAYSIEAVPPGSYVVLAAFENDRLVRDPDETIGGTGIARIEVSGAAVAVPTSFKITGALEVLSPGASGLEVITTAEPVFRWKDDASEDGYELRVFDALGNLVHENLDVGRTTGTDPSYPWTGATLQAGMIYQFRAVSWRDKKPAEGQGRTYISATEDLRGVFQYQP